MNRFQLSPAARLLVSFALVIGILVAGRTHRFSPRAAQAQTESEEVTTTASVSLGAVVELGSGEVVGPVISAYGVSIDGVPTDFVLGGTVGVFDGYLVSDGLTSFEGVGISGQSPESPKDGVGISGQMMMQNVVISSEFGVQVSGGQLLGDNISVENGVLTGTNLRIVGATVTGTALSVSSVAVADSGY